MTPALWGIAIGAEAVALLGSFLWGYAVGKRRVATKLSRDLAAAEERLEAAKRGEGAQSAQDKAENLARGRMVARAAKRIRDRLRAQESGRDG